MYTAVIRRVAGSAFKTPKRLDGSNLFFPDTCTRNVSTFFTQWPKHLTQHLCYGHSAHAEVSYPSNPSARTLACAPRRTYGNLAAAELAEDAKELARLADGGAKLLTYPLHETAEPPERTSKPPKPRSRMTLHKLKLKCAKAEPLSMLTAYDYPSARLADAAGVDVLLVGDSVGMVVLGREDTTTVTMDEMVHHCRAAARGNEHALLLGDLPFGACISPYEAALNGVRLVKEGRVDAVKIEGGSRMVPHVQALLDAGVAVCGHIGLTPQSHAQLGGYRVQGRTAEGAQALVEDAKALEAAGCFAIVLEMVPAPVAAAVTEAVSIPTFGIGAGGGTSGQVQVFHDVLGLYDKVVPKFSRQFGHFEQPMVESLREYTHAVGARTFPQPAVHDFTMSADELGKFRKGLELGDGDAAKPAGSPPAPHLRTARTGGATVPFGAPRATGAASAAGLHLASSPGSPLVVSSVGEWRRLQASGALPHKGVGLVPTMGALHDGHLSLVRRAQRENERTAVSVFVNPKQFAPTEDLGTYPRPWEHDLSQLTQLGVDVVFAPHVDEMYPPHRPARLAPFVDFAGVDGVTAEGAARPGFFRGVATVVTKLLNIVQPRAVYFGQKDGLQCVVVRRLIEDLDFDTHLVVAPTVREPDGLAMSSRNVYLSPAHREAAPAVYASLLALSAKYDAGERDAARLRAIGAAVIAAEPSMSLEYLSLASAVDASEYDAPGAQLTGPAEPTLASIAVKIGTTRLIDNVVLA